MLVLLEALGGFGRAEGLLFERIERFEDEYGAQEAHQGAHDEKSQESGTALLHALGEQELAKQKAQALKDEQEGGIGNQDSAGQIAQMASGAEHFLGELGFCQGDFIVHKIGGILFELLEEVDKAGWLLIHGIAEGGAVVGSAGPGDAPGGDCGGFPRGNSLLEEEPASWSQEDEERARLREAFRNLAAPKPKTKRAPKTISGRRRVKVSTSSRKSAASFLAQVAGQAAELLGHPLGRLCQEGVLLVAQPLASRPQRLRIVINLLGQIILLLLQEVLSYLPGLPQGRLTDRLGLLDRGAALLLHGPLELVELARCTLRHFLGYGRQTPG